MSKWTAIRFILAANNRFEYRKIKDHSRWRKKRVIWVDEIRREKQTKFQQMAWIIIRKRFKKKQITNITNTISRSLWSE